MANLMLWMGFQEALWVVILGAGAMLLAYLIIDTLFPVPPKATPGGEALAEQEVRFRIVEQDEFDSVSDAA